MANKPDLNHPLFDRIWRTIRNWDIGRPFAAGGGRSGASGDDVQEILDALDAEPSPLAMARKEIAGLQEAWGRAKDEEFRLRQRAVAAEEREATSDALYNAAVKDRDEARQQRDEVIAALGRGLEKAYQDRRLARAAIDKAKTLRAALANVRLYCAKGSRVYRIVDDALGHDSTLAEPDVETRAVALERVETLKDKPPMSAETLLEVLAAKLTNDGRIWLIELGRLIRETLDRA